MTVTMAEAARGIRSIAAARAVVEAMPLTADELPVAQLRLDELTYFWEVRAAREAIADACYQRSPSKYPVWTCCEVHCNLAATHAELDVRARALGVERLPDSTIAIVEE